jgi:hypothetical protein
MVIELGSFTTIAFCAVKILRCFSLHTRRMISSVQACTTSGFVYLRRHSVEMNRQIVSALIMQATMPFLASAVNVFCVAACLSNNIIHQYVNIPLVVTLMTLYFPWLPALNPLVTMLLVKSYRQCLLGGFRKGTAVGPANSIIRQHDSAVYALQK